MRFKSRSRALVGAAAAGLLGLAGLTMVAPSVGAEPAETQRLAGEERWGTAADIATEAYPDGTDTVVLANGLKFPDALASGGLAGANDAPILLTLQDSLPAETEAALTALDPTNIIVTGGTAVVSDDLVAALEADGFTVTRVAGEDRFETAADIAAELGTVDTVFLANGLKFPDALAISPGSAKAELPVLLTPADSLNADAAAAIEASGASNVVILGGTAAVSQDIEDGLEADGLNVTREAGATRYETATEVADYLIAEHGFTPNPTHLATGEKFPDALAGGPFAALNNGPIILTFTESLAPAAQTWLEANAEAVDFIWVFGGTAAVSDATVAAAAAAADEGVEGQSGVVTSFDTGANTYTFTDSATNTSVTVSYDATNDVFTVDGDTASLAAFEAALSVGDQVNFVNDAATTTAADADEHHLTNVNPSSINSGTIGNIDNVADTYDIIDPVSGVVLRGGLDYTGDVVFVDGAVVNNAQFDAAINEGDTIQIEVDAASNETHRLTNQTVSGNVSATANPLIRIGNLGDDPTDGTQDTDYDTSLTGSTFTVDGESATFTEFWASATVGDELSHTRNAGVQTFALTNVAPPEQSGTLTNVFDTTADTATLVDGDDDISIDYSAVNSFRLNGAVVTEGEAEAAMTAGDAITHTPDNPDTAGDEGRLSVTDQTLAGLMGDVDTGANTYDVLNAAANEIYNDLDYTASVFGGVDRYFVNDTEVDQATWEAYLAEVAADTSPDDTVEVIDNNTSLGADISTEHRLTTDETI